jgi:phosphoribosylformylglycinamidine cyclo-ligase
VGAETYRSAGVDVAACDAWLGRLGEQLPAIGGFGGLFPLGPHIREMREPCLVASADGVGTKLLVAQAAGDLSTIGIDCVAMVVNDLVCCGARPLFFLDYLAVERFSETMADAVLGGIQRGCAEAGCELIGGETAELPGLLPTDRFDICGFGVGAVDRAKAIDGSSIAAGDAIIGLPSSGLHSNGFSLARRVLPAEAMNLEMARALLEPTRIYVQPVLAMLDEVKVKGIAHITGGGLPGNLRRVLPQGVDARLDPAAWDRHAIFDMIARSGEIEPGEMFRTFNMGIGLCLVVAAEHAEPTLRALHAQGARAIGEIAAGSGQVHIHQIHNLGVDL